MLYFGDTVGIRPAARLGMDGRQIFRQGGIPDVPNVLYYFAAVSVIGAAVCIYD